MNAIGSAVYTALNGDAALAALGCTGVHYEVAPDTARPPYLTHGPISSLDHYTFGERAWEEHLWTVRAWDVGQSTLRAGQIMDRVDELLTDQQLTAPGQRVIVCRRTERIPTPVEIDDQTGEHIRGAGARYLIGVSP